MRRRIVRADLIAPLALVLTGCAVGPRYHQPAMPATDGFVAATPESASPAAPPDRWWALYQDPALDALVERALVHNADLRVAAANLAQARGALLSARAGLLPATSVSAGPTYGKSTTQNLVASLKGQPAQPEWYYSSQFDASYEVDLFGHIRRGLEAAKADVQARAAARDLVRVSVAAETTRAYVNACAYAQSIAVAQHALDLVTQTYQITQKQVGLGASSDFDLARAATLVEQTRAAIPPLEDQRRAALFQLSVLTGRTPEQVDSAAAACAKPPSLTTPLPVGDGAAMLKRRPDVREAERTLAASTARVGVAIAGLYPTVTLGGTIAGSGVKANQMFSSSGLSYGIGPLITWNFPNLVAQAGQVAQARAASSGALAQFDATVLAALQDMETSLSAYAGEMDRHKALTAARDQAAIAWRLAKARYEGGQASYLDVLTSEQSLVAAELALTASDQLLVSDQIGVFKALGGGWQGAPSPAKTSDWAH